MACDVPLSSKVSQPVDRRLRMLALLQDQPLSHVLNGVLDKALPPADKLAALLLGSGEPDGAAPEPEAA